jgi:hypothetical protein
MKLKTGKTGEKNAAWESIGNAAGAIQNPDLLGIPVTFLQK